MTQVLLSRKLILGMIDKYSSIFRSEYFNICGDETFDLGFDVNKDKDKGELYYNEYKRLWMQKNKESELKEVLNIFERAEQTWDNLK